MGELECSKDMEMKSSSIKNNEITSIHKDKMIKNGVALVWEF